MPHDRRITVHVPFDSIFTVDEQGRIQAFCVLPNGMPSAVSVAAGLEIDKQNEERCRATTNPQ